MAEEKENWANQPTEDEMSENGPVDSGEDIIEGEIVEESVPEEAAQVDMQALAEELQQSQKQAKEYFEGWQRERADFANYKRRVERDQQMMAQNMKSDLVKRYLTVMDDLERALKARPTEGPSASWSEGIELIQRKLQNILEGEGIKRIPAESEEFDPSRHEAITYEDSPDHKSGEIIEVVQQGYMLGDRVIRPALVRVARG